MLFVFYVACSNISILHNAKNVFASHNRSIHKKITINKERPDNREPTKDEHNQEIQSTAASGESIDSEQ